MLRGQCSTAIRLCAQSASIQLARLSSSSRVPSQGPNAPLDLDPSYQDLLRDADMALLKYKPRENAEFGSSSARELEVLEFDEAGPHEAHEENDEIVTQTERKSARARFGSKGIGSVFLPTELRESIERVINEADKPRLHEDAKRLFLEENRDKTNLWHTFLQTNYKSWKQAHRHAERDGTAFASVALPAHYSAIYAVLDHIKHRLGDDWKVRNIMDWGSGIGSGLWASMHAFQELTLEREGKPESDPLLSQSTIAGYVGFDKRQGLSSMAKKLLEESNVGMTNVRWRKRYSDQEQVQDWEAGDVMALSAFHLSSLPTTIARKETVKQMWSSGADVIVLIDHDTTSGFSNIVEARDQLLRLGKKEQEDLALKDGPTSGCHVVAPCPHDGACPLFNSGKPNLKCSFSQRLQRPAFLRKTKHVRAGHEDVGYSYVVIRRGKRPSIHRVRASTSASEKNGSAGTEHLHSIRLEAFDWPRMVFSPLKRSGHVIIDGCTAEGKIMRMTIPRSQGKQPYYDARKSSWGDIFPHKPKNAPQVRLEPKSKTGEASLVPGSDIGKRRRRHEALVTASYSKIYSDLKESRSDRRRTWHKDTDDLQVG